MILAHLKIVVGQDDTKHVAGATAYAIPKNTPLMIKRCDKHEDCYVLWSLEKRRGGNQQGEFF